MYGKTLIVKVREMTEGLTGEEQCGFRMRRGYVDQAFVIKETSEVFSERKSLYVAYLDLEKMYDRVDGNALWGMLNMDGVNGVLENVIGSF